MKPGATAFTVIPRLANSLAAASGETDQRRLWQLRNWPARRCPSSPTTEVMLMMRPLRCFNIGRVNGPRAARKDSGEVEIDHRLPVVGFHPHEEAVPRNPRVVHEHVDAATAIQDRFEQARRLQPSTAIRSAWRA